jgi:IS4 transposase
MAPAEVSSPEAMLKAQIALYPEPSQVNKKNPLKPGQLVRLSRIQERFEKDSYKFTLEVFKIRKVIKRAQSHVYEISDMNDEEVKGRFNADELLPIYVDPVVQQQ